MAPTDEDAGDQMGDQAAADVIGYGLIRDVAVITVDAPPVNALGHAVRSGLINAIDRAAQDDRAVGVVLAGSGQTFPAGAETREFDAPSAAPHLSDVCHAIEMSPKPVVACLHGRALGGGYELALAAHKRIALKGTRIGLPEIRLGLVPGAGGTQRLPRIVAIDDALSLMLTGQPVEVSAVLSKGFVDAVVEAELISAGVSAARELALASFVPTRARRDRFADADDFQEAVAAARIAYADHPTAAAACIADCVEASLLLPFEAGLAYEREALETLAEGAPAEALRYLFMAERRASKPRSGLPKPVPVVQVALVGGGLMGAGIAVSCLTHGLPVTLIEKSPKTAAETRKRISAIFTRAVERNKMRAARRERCLAQLTLAMDLTAAKEADLIIEAVPDEYEQKSNVLNELAGIAKPGALLASTTSYLDLDELAQATGRESDVLGLHFFAPAHVAKLLEVVIGIQTSPAAESAAFALARKINKQAVRTGVCEGFIGNRMMTAYHAASDRMLKDGASPYEIDAAMRDYGFPMGPYEMQDRSGLDIGRDRRKRLAAEHDAAAPNEEPTAERFMRIGDLMCAAGRLGQKVGRGYYMYPDGQRQGVEDPDVLELIASERAAKGITPRDIGPNEIQSNVLDALVNEGAHLLDEGIAERASDIDVALVIGFGFPRHKGGPMKAGEQVGLLKILQRLEERKDAFLEPADALREAVKNGNRFEGVL